MAEKVPQKFNYSTGRSCNSRNEALKVVHIGNPKIVMASESDFSAVVQSLTGNKKRSRKFARDNCSSPSKRVKRDCNEREQKIPKPEGKLELGPIQKSTQQRPMTSQILTAGVSESDDQQKEIAYDLSYHQMFETLEGLRDNDLFHLLFS